MNSIIKLTIILLFIATVSVIGFGVKLIKIQKENKILEKEVIFLKKLVLKGANRDSLYREHMGKTLYIDNNSVEIGHDNYLRLKNIRLVKNN